jgi:hypothetical protein
MPASPRDSRYPWYVVGVLMLASISGNIDRMIPHLAKDDQKLALIALAAGLKEMCDGLAALHLLARPAEENMSATRESPCFILGHAEWIPECAGPIFPDQHGRRG